VPIEIGNAEQIALLQKIERESRIREEDAKAGKLDVNVYNENIMYDVICEFTCVCGNEIKEKNRYYADDWEDLEDAEYEGGIITCKKCGREYEIEYRHAKLVEK
jgi:hypothetical protein